MYLLLFIQVGTPLYLAPEMVCGDRYDERIDLYAYGICLLEMAVVGQMVYDVSLGAFVCIDNLCQYMLISYRNSSGSAIATVAKVVNTLSKGFRPELPDFVPKELQVCIFALSA